jgi:cell division protein FtsQ
MTTLHVDRDRLDRVAADFPVVRELKVSPDFPNTLSIDVVEHHPAAIAVSGGARVPVAGDGTVLRGLPAQAGLPELQLRGALPAGRLREPAALLAARVLGGAPEPLRTRLLGVSTGVKGLTVKLREGPQLIFGDTTRLRAKWTAATRVLADPSARDATYIDLRLPDRPAAGGVASQTLEPVAPVTGSPATPQPVAPQAAPQQAPTTAAPPAPTGAAGGTTTNPQP